MATPISADIPLDFESEIGATLECTLKARFYYEPAQRGARENGVQMEPDYPEGIEVEDATLMLGDAQLPFKLDEKKVEELCWNHLKSLTEH